MRTEAVLCVVSCCSGAKLCVMKQVCLCVCVCVCAFEAQPTHLTLLNSAACLCQRLRRLHVEVVDLLLQAPLLKQDLVLRKAAGRGVPRLCCVVQACFLLLQPASFGVCVSEGRGGGGNMRPNPNKNNTVRYLACCCAASFSDSPVFSLSFVSFSSCRAVACSFRVSSSWSCSSASARSFNCRWCSSRAPCACAS